MRGKIEKLSSSEKVGQCIQRVFQALKYADEFSTSTLVTASAAVNDLIQYRYHANIHFPKTVYVHQLIDVPYSCVIPALW